MLFRDQFGYFHDVPDERFGGWASPGFGEVVYDGLGNPLGFPALAALLPLAAKILPIASSLLPMLAPSGSPSSPPSPAAPSPPPPPVPPFPLSPSLSPPQIIVVREPAPERSLFSPTLPAVQARPPVVFRRRGARRRRRPVRVKIERLREQVSVPPPALPPLPLATEASGGVNGWYPGEHFGNYY
jgi:hypothetical protein